MAREKELVAAKMREKQAAGTKHTHATQLHARMPAVARRVFVLVTYGTDKLSQPTPGRRAMGPLVTPKARSDAQFRDNENRTIYIVHSYIYRSVFDEAE